MSLSCPECGATISAGGTCQDNFHTLLLREATLPGVAGSLLHFYAVAAYGLQHPDSMNYTQDALNGLHAAVADALDGRATVEELRRRARAGANGRKRVTRRAEEAAVVWRRGGWPLNVLDVCTADAITFPVYAERLLRWVRATCATLDKDREA